MTTTYRQSHPYVTPGLIISFIVGIILFWGYLILKASSGLNTITYFRDNPMIFSSLIITLPVLLLLLRPLRVAYQVSLNSDTIEFKSVLGTKQINTRDIVKIESNQLPGTELRIILKNSRVISVSGFIRNGDQLQQDLNRLLPLHS